LEVSELVQKMKVGLFNVDSVIPNLALMKLSAYHKAQGDDVEFFLPVALFHYDKIYASTIFKDSDKTGIHPDMMEVGGTGWDLVTKLPDEVDAMVPDYSLFNYEHSIGFTSRGCRLKCSFCVVPQKEGKTHGVMTMEQIWTQRSSHHVVILDNDFFGQDQWEDRIHEMIDMKLQVNFNQGVNIRTLTEHQAASLQKVRFVTLSGKTRMIHCAWDNVKDERTVIRGINRLIDTGIHPKSITVYVLVGYGSTHQEDMHRILTLKGMNVNPYVMPFGRSAAERNLARWVNRKAVFHSCTYEDYIKTLTD
jgi:hypothetical protein